MDDIVGAWEKAQMETRPGEAKKGGFGADGGKDGLSGVTLVQETYQCCYQPGYFGWCLEYNL